MLPRLILIFAAFAPLGCLQWVVPEHSSAPANIHSPLVPENTFETLQGFDDMHATLCEDDGSHPNFPNSGDLLTKVFCQDKVPGGAMPKPTSLAELLVLLGLDFKDPNGGNGIGGNPGFALLGHSSALTARKVSSIMPTAFIFTPPPADGSKPSGYIFLAYDPGEQFVEIASHDPVTDEVNFYLVMFEKGCAKQAGGCKNKDLLTPNLVKDWVEVRQYESNTELNNTIADCRQCHAPDDTKPQILRMQENSMPFTHWFSQETSGGRQLFDEFHQAHPTNEDYGGIPASLLDKSSPALMAQMIKQAGFGDQPNAFDSTAIEAEMAASGKSATWQKIYDQGVAGKFIAAPYHDISVSDPGKLVKMSDAYKKWMSGGADIPDVREVFFDVGLRDMSFAPKAGLTPRAMVVQMCQQCHHSGLDPTISRENFLVDKLDEMTRQEKDLAIERMLLPDNDRLAMPPVLFRTISDAERQQMISELKK
ncbi:MAG: hypothetical protein JWN44_387 [Myxococcales bacterium]|nr:hypothetical protein [Myxococcales bacterium]